MQKKLLTSLLCLCAVPFALPALEACGSDSSAGGSSIGTPMSTGGGGSGGTTACTVMCPAAGSGGAAGAGGSSVTSWQAPTEAFSEAEVCVSYAKGVEPLPIDMFIMLDKSQSMTETLPSAPSNKWVAVTDALKQFVMEPAAQNIRVGLNFFGLPRQSGEPLADPNVVNQVDTCYIDPYATARVGMGAMGTNAPLIQQAIDAERPETLTPTAAALQGALKYMQGWSTANPGRQGVVVLATDGYPTECVPQDPSAIAQFAAAAAAGDPANGVPPIFTYVIGIGKNPNLNQIATAGKGQAFVIESGDAMPQFLSAMLSISAAPVPCSYTLDNPVLPGGTPVPDGGAVYIDPLKSKVTYTPPASDAVTLTRIRSATDCPFVPADGYGWWFDSETNPKVVNLCQKTCDKMRAGPISIEAACTIIPPLQ